MGHIIAALVDMLMQASQHRAPRTVSWKFRPRAHQQCTIIDCPHKALEIMSIIHIQQGQGVRHAGLLKPVPSLSALVREEAEDLVGDYNLFVSPLLLLDLVIDVKKVHPMQRGASSANICLASHLHDAMNRHPCLAS